MPPCSHGSGACANGPTPAASGIHAQCARAGTLELRAMGSEPARPAEAVALMPRMDRIAVCCLISRLVCAGNTTAVTILPMQCLLSHRSDLARSERGQVVMAVGRLASVKRHELLIDAWSQISHLFPAWTLRIFGEGLYERTPSSCGCPRPTSIQLMGHTKGHCRTLFVVLHSCPSCRVRRFSFGRDRSSRLRPASGRVCGLLGSEPVGTEQRERPPRALIGRPRWEFAAALATLMEGRGAAASLGAAGLQRASLTDPRL
jgi:hypothetical protein